MNRRDESVKMWASCSNSVPNDEYGRDVQYGRVTYISTSPLALVEGTIGYGPNTKPLEHDAAIEHLASMIANVEMGFLLPIDHQATAD